jgi:hypothetical protein
MRYRSAILDLDVDAMIELVNTLPPGPNLAEHGAVVINNPHNGTGCIFIVAIRKLITYALQHNLCH